MEISDAIKQRRSIRKFSDRPVSDALLLELVHAGAIAPSASNLQAWQFVVINEPELVRKVNLFSPGLSGKPPVIIAICSDMEHASMHGSKNSEIYGCMMDASMAAENIMLKALEFGLGTCAIKSYNVTAVTKLLKLPDHFRMELLISVGYPESDLKPRRLRPLEEIMHWNAWEETT
ncbi:nitroreductase family protein [Oscillospiraceae bacterium LTW-04]|nr:nitroreductase family protein [Oscillospiraceae bacterium MB24-C1]